ncbi:F-box/LRR-repeat protein At4g29420-like [Musa acuminata AAA Group]|uniref:F-box/LRR-repeat protein At4g29420-like n=1 Tax=Musa acuminata AAA Group TaxID=214697 RepID=UPI0031DA4EFF
MRSAVVVVCSLWSMELEDLPSPVLVEILSRLGDSTELARCRLASRTLRSLSRDVRSVRLFCSRDRFLRSRAPDTCDHDTPFRSLVANLASFLSASPGPLALALAAERPLSAPADEVDDADDLHLTAVPFLARWLPLLAARLRSLAIDDYWLQSCWRPSQALSLIADICHDLVNLEVRNAWLSVEELKPMHKLTSLTLEFIRLDDANLDKVNECFPSLQALNLIGVGGLKEPKIHLLQLRVCTWTVSNFVLSLTVCAPKLVELKLKCVEPESLHLETPLLSELDVTIKKARAPIVVGEKLNLRSLRIESSDLCNLAQVFAPSRTIKRLELEAYGSSHVVDLVEQCTIDLLSTFPDIDELVLGPRAWFILPENLSVRGELKNLKKLMVHLAPEELDAAMITWKLTPLLTHARYCQVVMLIPAAASMDSRTHVISKCISNFPGIRWKWDTWKCG